MQMIIPTSPTTTDVRRQLIRNETFRKITELSDEEYRRFQSGLIPGKDAILGVRVPKLRALAQEIARRGLPLPEGDAVEWREFLDAMDGADAENPGSYEKVLLTGLILGYAKMPYEELLIRVKKFVPKIDNWATCDIFCSSLKAVQKRREETWTFLESYLALGIGEQRNPADPETEYPIRFAVVMLISHFVTEEYADRMLAVLNEVRHDGYYVKMAVAWALSICFIKFPDKTMELYQENHLDDFTHNKALQKTVESFRVDAETKDLLRSMKRRQG